MKYRKSTWLLVIALAAIAVGWGVWISLAVEYGIHLVVMLGSAATVLFCILTLQNRHDDNKL